MPEYGIGRFQGLKTLSVNDILHDFIEILYVDNDKLYLSVENLETISRYGEENQNVALNKLCGVTWKMRKAKLKERIKLAAASALINTTAKRLTTQGHVLEPIHENYQKFCDNFPYITTADQESAIEEIMEDFKSGQPMDRLLCADVGFGKTEVALRAAAAATLGLETVQVAVIVPTTLLARQHYITFSERFKISP
ncbi:MAG: DEAD/DEAH box helicase [Candidatus Midichloria sp.]|nr:DEAD/DEAH box helicase [Candidatus Midichloria sp.]